LNLPHHVQRMVAEFDKLREDTMKLGAFIYDNPLYKTLIEEEQQDMRIQWDAMCIYCDALERRLKRAK